MLANYLNDVFEQLVEESLELKEMADDDEFQRGKLFAYYEILSKLLNQAEAFGFANQIDKKWRDYPYEDLLS
jgi:hypothetical protein